MIHLIAVCLLQQLLQTISSQIDMLAGFLSLPDLTVGWMEPNLLHAATWWRTSDEAAESLCSEQWADEATDPQQS